jgi:molybdenum cofactor cytidylyltransferase
VSVGGLVLAAGSSSRFGSPKPLARLEGSPLLQHVLDAAASADLRPIVVVLGERAPEIERAIQWRSERRIVNAEPARGLSSSLREGIAAFSALGPGADAVVLLGDQPRTSPDVIRHLIEAAGLTDRPIVAPRYSGGGGANPVFLRRDAFHIAGEARDDRGLGPILTTRPDLVSWIDVAGSNPDVDTPADLLALQAAGC